MKTIAWRNIWLFLLAGLFLSGTSAFAAEIAVPSVVNNFIGIFISLASGKIGIMFIILILAMSGFMAWKNGNITPLFWGFAAALMIGASPFIASELTNFGKYKFSDTNPGTTTTTTN